MIKNSCAGIIKTCLIFCIFSLNDTRVEAQQTIEPLLQSVEPRQECENVCLQENYSPCFVQPSCTYPRLCLPNSPYVYVIAGGALGAATGALTGYLATNGRGPAGKNFEFEKDSKECLVFEFEAVITSSGPAEYLPFVTLPNGITETLIEGEISLPTTSNGVKSIIVISNPLFGLYSAGIRIEKQGNSSSTFPVDLNINVVASRDDSSTNILNETGEMYSLDPSEQLQISANFTYAKTQIP